MQSTYLPINTIADELLSVAENEELEVYFGNQS